MNATRVSGWILPDGSWVECHPWEHVRTAKSLPVVLEQRGKDPELVGLWDDPDDEKLRGCLARIGLVKVCYHLVDADTLTPRQLRMLQQVYGFHSLDEEIEFIGRIRGRVELRILMKIRDPERLNTLGI
jgi:hypothetical protein